MKYDVSKLELNNILTQIPGPKQLEFDHGGDETWYETMKRKQTAWADYDFALKTESLKKNCSLEAKVVLQMITSLQRNIGAKSIFSSASFSASAKANFSDVE